jgi:maltose alpha-D-glucosyltransferase / alpha-amylase
MSTSDRLWYKDAVFYELHVKAFQDANADGVGDFRGLVERLDYVKDLNVDAIWLLPFYPSPLKDDGYDIGDYYGIHPSYGTIEDFQRFLDEAHKRGLKVIADLVLNHTSSDHQWFQRARRAPKGSPERDYYVWSDDDTQYKEARIIFTDTEPSNWTWDPVAGQYYWHRFFSHQPDLNWDNPEVKEKMFEVMEYWLERGLDGFRADAVPYLIEREGTICENLPETHDILKEFRTRLDSKFPGRILLAEANQWPEDVRPYFGDGDEFHMAFHFPLMPRIFMAVRQGIRKPIVEIIEQTPEIPADTQWCMFLRNHDELTLEMVTDEERDYMYQEYADDPRMRLNLGIRRRLAPLMDNDRRKIELLNSILFTMPGSPIVYYGDELGMGDNIFLGDRDGVRTPMQWSPDRNGGFSRAEAARLYAPLIVDSVYGYAAINVEAQQRSPFSLLNWMKRLIQVRKEHRAFGRGTIEFLEPENPHVLAYLREYDGDVILVVNNLSGSAQPVTPGPVALLRKRSGGAARADRLSPHRRDSVRAHAGAVRVLLVRAPAARAGGGRGRHPARGVGGAGDGGVREPRGACEDDCRVAPRLAGAPALVPGQGAGDRGAGPLRSRRADAGAGRSCAAHDHPGPVPRWRARALSGPPSASDRPARIRASSRSWRTRRRPAPWSCTRRCSTATAR